MTPIASGPRRTPTGQRARAAPPPSRRRGPGPGVTCRSPSPSASLLGGLALLTLFTVKATFLLYVGAIVAVALWELSRALGSRGIHLPLIPVAAGGAAMVTLAYWVGRHGTRWPRWP